MDAATVGGAQRNTHDRRMTDGHAASKPHQPRFLRMRRLHAAGALHPPTHSLPRNTARHGPGGHAGRLLRRRHVHAWLRPDPRCGVAPSTLPTCFRNCALHWPNAPPWNGRRYSANASPAPRSVHRGPVRSSASAGREPGDNARSPGRRPLSHDDEAISFSDTPGPAPTASPVFGQHSNEVLEGYGYSEAEIAALRKGGVVL